jgi:dynamin 1-like protein
VRQEIENLTDKVCGKSKNIIDKPIVLNVFSHTCPDLTLIDLPGITRIPLAGSDQPENIEKITRQMAQRYVGDPRTIILCVVPANADMTTSDGLQMARELDPKGIRTIGVITKVDIMDRGVNAKRMIMNQEVPLKLGFVAVKNRA